MRRARAPNPHKRDGTWYLVRRVPKDYELLDRRGLVRISTGIAVADDPRAVRAGDMVKQLNRELEAYWRGLADGQSGEARLRFEAAQKRARALGLTYQTNQELAEGQVEDLVNRFKLLMERNTVEDEGEVAAVLGGEKRPSILLSGLFDEYETIEAEALVGKSEGQQRKWRNPKKRAITNLIEVVGDMEIAELTRNHALDFRTWWQKRIAAEGLDKGTANKDIGHISTMLTAVDEAHRLGLDPVFQQLKLKGVKRNQRTAYEPEFVRDRILVQGALGDLNDEALHLVYLIADSGLRPSEAVTLDEKTIILNHAVPHVKVLADGRQLKTDHSEREVPLVGYALAVAKLHPNGFPRYRDKADSLSALVNDVLGEKGLRPTDKHSLYSLRHTFEDRLTDIDAPDKVIATLMGHKWARPKYGRGPKLEQKRRWMQKIAFNPPRHLRPPSS